MSVSEAPFGDTGKPKIFGPLIVLVISVVESFHYLQSIVVKTALGTFHAVNHAAGWYRIPPATD